MRTGKGGGARLGWVGELVLNSMNDVYMSHCIIMTQGCIFSQIISSVVMYDVNFWEFYSVNWAKLIYFWYKISKRMKNLTFDVLCSFFPK